MTVKTYQILEDQKKLIYEELYNTSNKLIQSIDSSTKSKIEKKFEYNNQGLIIKEISINNGKKVNTVAFEYDANGKLVSQKLFFENELFEETIISYLDNNYIETIFQDGVELERIEETEDGKNSTMRFYNYGDLTETQVKIYNSLNNSSTTKIFDEDNNLVALRIEEFDKNDNIIKFQEFDADNNLLFESKYKFENNLKVKQLYRDYNETQQEYIYINKYDDHNNLILSETRTLDNDLLDFHRRRYDTENNLVEESGYSRGNFDAIYGTYINDEEFHFVHEHIKTP